MVLAKLEGLKVEKLEVYTYESSLLTINYETIRHPRYKRGRYTVTNEGDVRVAVEKCFLDWLSYGFSIRTSRGPVVSVLIFPLANLVCLIFTIP